MPSDFEPISGCRCVGCGRESDKVALKRLNTYSRSFSCLTCYLKYSNCANCGHKRHAAIQMVVVPGAHRPPEGRCHCGCADYKHGLEAEFDRQFAEHTGKAPTQRKCNHCSNWFYGTTLWCESCERDWRSLNG